MNAAQPTMSSSRLIKKLSDEVSLVGNYLIASGTPRLWGVRLVSTSPAGPKAHAHYSDGDLPSRETLHLGGFIAENYVGLNLDRHYRVEDAAGAVVFKDSLT